MKMTELDKARFWVKVRQTDYCWIWVGAQNKDGYGQFRFTNETLAHRISFQLINGNISKKKLVCHSCDNRSCVNPSHLYVGTQFNNMFDKQIKGTHRRQGRSSKYNGVSFRNDSKRWRSWIKFNGKMKSLGNYKDEKEAAIVYDQECYRLFNRKEMLNFPELF